MDPRNISGSLKAAILIRSLGSEAAGFIFNSLTGDEKLVVQGHLDEMGAIPADAIEYVAKEFIDKAARRASMAQLSPPSRSDGKESENDASMGVMHDWIKES